MRKICIIISLILFLMSIPCLTFAESLNAVRSSQRLEVDGVLIENAEFYNINGHNYFKLRDLAYLLKDTPQKFSIQYNESKRQIEITSGIWSQNTSKGLSSGASKNVIAVKSSQGLYIDDNLCDVDAYNIKGNNYYKLADLAEYLNFNLVWQQYTKTVLLNTDKSLRSFVTKDGK